MTEIDFYKLSRPLQDGLIDAVSGRFTPAPIVSLPGTKRSVLAWLTLSFVATLAILALAAAGFGDMASRFALHPTPGAAAYAILAALIILGVLRALAYRARSRALPFPPGIYLFPASLIDARDHVLRLYPITSLTGVAASGGSVAVRFKGAAFSFPVAEPARAQEIVAAVEDARDRMKKNPDAAERRRLDPLEPPVVESPLAPPVPLSRTPAGWERFGWLIAVVAGAAAGGGIFLLRNLLSDERMFAIAHAKDEVATYKSYVARGRRHVDEVGRVLLPRAELRLAVAEGSVEAIDAFIEAYPSTRIQSEIDAAQRAALVAELERRKKVGTLAALFSFSERYPRSGLDKAVAEAKHALYAKALAHYKAEMPKGAEPIAEIVGRLLAYAEKTGPKATPQGLRGPAVQIRFRRLPSQDLDRAEESASRSPMYGGVTSLPSRYLTDQDLEPQEKATAQAIADGLARAFDPEIVTFEAGPRMDAAAPDPIVVTVPTLAVAYHIEPSGAAQSRTRPRGIFLGLSFLFREDFALPEDNKPLGAKYRSLRPIPTELLVKDKGLSAPGVLEAQIYGAMARDAFADVRDKTLSKWLKPREEKR